MEDLVALIALALMEIVLGIDNIVFLAIVTSRLPDRQRSLARRIGLLLAMGMRIGLLLGIKWLMGMTEPIFELTSIGIPKAVVNLFEHPEHVNSVTLRDIVLISGGLFLIGKSVFEVHEKLDHQEVESNVKPAGPSLFMALVQICVLDIIFSLDSVITAVGMAESRWVMVAAIVLAVGVMMIFANPVSEFVSKHPTLIMLALSFLILIGIVLIAEGMGTSINKGYIYFAMAFSLIVEMLNMRLRKSPVSTSQIQARSASE